MNLEVMDKIISHRNSIIISPLKTPCCIKSYSGSDMPQWKEYCIVNHKKRVLPISLFPMESREDSINLQDPSLSLTKSANISWCPLGPSRNSTSSEGHNHEWYSKLKLLLDYDDIQGPCSIFLFFLFAIEISPAFIILQILKVLS